MKTVNCGAGGEGRLRRYDVVAIGEPVVDFVELPASERGNPVYEAYAGGGACNVLASVTAWGGSAGLLGAVGDDLFGDFLAEKLRRAGVATTALHRTDAKNTGIGFVRLREDGERSFLFYRNPEKNVRLFRPEDSAVLAEARIFHATSVSMAGPAALESTLAAVDSSRGLGSGVSFDVNLRPAIWAGRLSRARDDILAVLRKADIAKMSEEERDWLFGDVSNERCAEILHGFGVTFVAVSLGAAGSFFSFAGGRGACPSIPVKMVDSTGCGDAFVGALLAQIAQRGGVRALPGMDVEAVRGIVANANAAGAICASRFGSFTIMPTRGEIERARAEAGGGMP